MPETRFRGEKFSAEILFDSFYAAAPKPLSEPEERKLKNLITQYPEWRAKLIEVAELWSKDQKADAKALAEKIIPELKKTTI